MNKKLIEQNKIDKCQVFDCFMKKHNIKELKVFSRSYSKNIFGLNALYYTNGISYAMCDIVPSLVGVIHCSGIGPGIASDFICKNEVPKRHSFKAFALKDFPRIYKEAVIDHCIGTGISIIITNATDTQVLIPASNCLEELAIKMELET